MSDVFISYAREDFEAARRLAKALEAQEWSVFWDRTIPAGRTWREVIGAALADARCVVVLWSQNSVNSHWVIEEADYGLRRRVLIPAFLERIEPPLGFGSIQAADLSTWAGDHQDAAMQQFLGDLAGILGPAPAVRAEKRREADAETKRNAEQQYRQQAEADAKREAVKERERKAAAAAEAKEQEKQRQWTESRANREAAKKREHAEAEAKQKDEEQWRHQAEVSAKYRRNLTERFRQIFITFGVIFFLFLWVALIFGAR